MAETNSGYKYIGEPPEGCPALYDENIPCPVQAGDIVPDTYQNGHPLVIPGGGAFLPKGWVHADCAFCGSGAACTRIEP